MTKTYKLSLIAGIVLFLINGFGVYGQTELLFDEFSKPGSVKIQLTNETKALDHCMNARDLFIKQDYATAIKYCSKAIEINPSSSAAYRLRGYSQILSGSLEKGCADLKKASLLGENSTWAKIAKKHFDKYCKKD